MMPLLQDSFGLRITTFFRNLCARGEEELGGRAGTILPLVYLPVAPCKREEGGGGVNRDCHNCIGRQGLIHLLDFNSPHFDKYVL